MGRPGTWQIVVLLLIIVLLFGAPKLPELARSVGQSLRILKAETKQLVKDEDQDGPPAEPVATTPTAKKPAAKTPAAKKSAGAKPPAKKAATKKPGTKKASDK
ncbi:MAG: twin-arginine translocase TatA/TatE family subunit [Actinobacteria bacterium HGW-Actinobacteria-4]|nr:MAG: twin-arginine translocase TatA/TatE family subunit [Actinobacteria bacterium HGW-Actinobacteria-4]